LMKHFILGTIGFYLSLLVVLLSVSHFLLFLSSTPYVIENRIYNFFMPLTGNATKNETLTMHSFSGKYLYLYPIFIVSTFTIFWIYINKKTNLIKSINQRHYIGSPHSLISIRDGDRSDLHWDKWLIVPAGAGAVDGINNIHTALHTGEHGVLGRRRLVPEVQEAVGRSVDEELASATVGLTSVGHGQSARLVTETRATWFTELIRNAAITCASNCSSARDIEGGSACWAASSCFLAVRIS